MKHLNLLSFGWVGLGCVKIFVQFFQNFKTTLIFNVKSLQNALNFLNVE